jgi:hypothetical protein
LWEIKSLCKNTTTGEIFPSCYSSYGQSIDHTDWVSSYFYHHFHEENGEGLNAFTDMEDAMFIPPLNFNATKDCYWDYSDPILKKNLIKRYKLQMMDENGNNITLNDVIPGESSKTYGQRWVEDYRDVSWAIAYAYMATAKAVSYIAGPL